MKKKMYNQPATDVLSIRTEYMMQSSMVVSDGGNSSEYGEINSD